MAANDSYATRAKKDRRKVKLKKNNDKYGIALNDNHNTKIYKATKMLRFKRFTELKKEYPNLKYIQ